MNSTFVRRAFALAAMTLASASHSADFGSNLIVNGDAEAGNSGWTAFDGVELFTSAAYSSNWVQPGEPGPVDRGSNLFVGGSGQATAAGFQAADLGSFGAAIAAGSVNYSLSGWLGGWKADDDNAVLIARFFDAGSNPLASATLGPVLPPDRGNLTGLVLVNTSGAVPVGASSVQFILEMTRNNGGDNDGYADNLSFTLAQAVPEPGTYALMLAGLGAVGIAAARRRTSRQPA